MAKQSSLQILEQLIEQVKRLSASSASTADVAWSPLVPRGHTNFTWTGAEDNNVAQSAAAAAPATAAAIPVAATSAPAAAPAAAAAAPAAADEKKPQQQQQQQQKPKEKAEKKPQQQQQPKEKQAKQDNQKAKAAEPVPESKGPAIALLEFKVGQVVKAERHPNADKMYVEMIDVGEEKPRQIASGLVGLVPLEELQSSRVIVVTNLAPAVLRGVESQGMVLAASNADHTQAALVVPPAGAKVGERVIIQGMEADFQSTTPEKQINLKKAPNAWVTVAPDLRTDDNGRACFKGAPFVTSAGACTSTLKQAIVK